MRRKFVGVLAFGLAIVSIAITARYGFKQGDEVIDRWIAAILYGAIALCTCVFDGLAVWLWFKRARKTGVFVGMVALLAFLVTFTNSLGGIASRADAVMAKRQSAADSVADGRRALRRLEDALANLRYVPTDEAAVAAAKHAADVAASNRQAECEKRGPNCRQRELDDQEAARKLAQAATKAATDRAMLLEGQIATIKARLDKPADQAVGQADPLGNLLHNIIGAAAETLTAWQQAIVALVFELCLVCLMVGYAVLGEVSPAPQKAAPVTGKPAQEPKIEMPAQEAPRLLPSPSRPKLVASNQPMPRDLVAVLTQLLDKAPKGRVGVVDLYGAYATQVTQDRLAPAEFFDHVERFCRIAGIKISGQHLIGVRFVVSLQQAAAK